MYKFHEFVADLTARYGPISRFDVFGTRAILVNDAETSKRILTTPLEFGRGPYLQEMFDGLLYYALFVLPAGDTWKRHRKGVQVAFGPANIRQTFAVTLKVMDQVYSKLDHLLSLGNPTNKSLNSQCQIRVNMHKIFSVIALDVIGQVAFSENLNNVQNLQDDSTEKSTPIQDITASVAKTVDLRMTYPRPSWNFLGLSGEFMRQKVKPIDLHLKAIIRARLEQGPKQESDTVDIIDRLLFLKDDSGNPVFSDQEISEEVLSFFFAGHETTSNVLTSIIRRLCENTSVMNKLFEQVKELPLTFEAVQSCK